MFEYLLGLFLLVFYIFLNPDRIISATIIDLSNYFSNCIFLVVDENNIVIIYMIALRARIVLSPIFFVYGDIQFYN